MVINLTDKYIQREEQVNTYCDKYGCKIQCDAVRIMHWLTASINIIVNWRGVGSRIKGSITEIITIDWTGSLKSSRSTYLWGHWNNSYVAENIDTTLVHWNNNSKISPHPPNKELFICPPQILTPSFWQNHAAATMQSTDLNQTSIPSSEPKWTLQSTQLCQFVHLLQWVSHNTFSKITQYS